MNPGPVINEHRLKLLKMLLLRKPHTVEQLIDVLDCSERTVYRDLKVLQDRGCKIYRVGTQRPTQYSMQTLRA